MRASINRVMILLAALGSSACAFAADASSLKLPRGAKVAIVMFEDLQCPDCDIHYAEPTPAAFSFNSPLGACEACRGFGRVIGVDFGLVVPDEAKTLKEGVSKAEAEEIKKKLEEQGASVELK